MIAVLDDWNDRCVQVLGEIEGQVLEARRKARERRQHEEEHQKVIERLMDDDGLKERGGSKRGAYDAEGGEPMDVDESLRRGGLRGAKRGGGGGAGTGGFRHSGFGRR